MGSSFTVLDLPQSERPRERMVSAGPEALSSVELIALVLGRGIQGESVLVTSQKLLAQFGSLEGVLDASLSDLQTIRGMGIAKATQLKACLEIARRVIVSRAHTKTVLMNPHDIFNLLSGTIGAENKEHLVVLSFDVRNQLCGSETVAIGILNAHIIHPREIFESAIRHHASYIVICHNHPSGICEPSEADIDVTSQLVTAGTTMGIPLVDHVIVSQSSYYSFVEHALL